LSREPGFFHGSREPIYAMTNDQNPANIYAGAFYSTDDLGIGYEGYAGKGPHIYRVHEIRPVKFLDIEKPMPDWAKQAIKEVDAGVGFHPSEHFELPNTRGGNTPYLQHYLRTHPNMSLREWMDIARDQMPWEARRRYFQRIVQDAEGEGIGGWRHLGGAIGSGAYHNVKIYFRPQEQIVLRPALPEVIRGPGKTGALVGADLKKFLKEEAGEIPEEYGLKPEAVLQQTPTQELPRPTQGLIPYEQKQLGISAGEVTRLKPEEIVAPNAELKSEPGYLYHGTTLENAREIHYSRFLEAHEPGFGTEQDAWPDGSDEQRSYWTSDAAATRHFTPEGQPVVLRVNASKVGTFRREKGTGDYFTRQAVPADQIQIFTKRGWRPLSELGTAPLEGPVEEPDVKF